MKRLFAVILGFLLVSVSLFGSETDDFDWLIKGEWYLEMTDDGDFVYWHQTPKANFRKYDILGGTTLYRGAFDVGLFEYFYPIGTENMVLIGNDKDDDGEDDILEIATRNNYSYLMIESTSSQSGLPIFHGGGDRKGDMININHPFVGEWLDPRGNLRLDVRLVEPADYRYFLRIDKVPGFAYTQGWYLLKYLGDGVFESESSFEEGRLRFEVKKSGRILITPLFEKKDGIAEKLEPIQMRPWDRVPLEYFKKYGSEEKPKKPSEPASVAVEQSKEQSPATTGSPVAKTEAPNPAAGGVDTGDSNTIAYILGAAAAVIILAAAAVLLLRKRRKAA